MRASREAGPHLRSFLTDAGNPECHLALPLEISRFHIEAAHHRHDAIELRNLRLSKVSNRLMIDLVAVRMTQFAVWCHEAQCGIGVRHGSNLAGRFFPA